MKTPVSGKLACAMTELLRPGTLVELVSPQGIYEVGARGVVARVEPMRSLLLVRFDETGHALFVPRDDVKPADGGRESL